MKKFYTFSLPACAVLFVILLAGFGGDENTDNPVGAPPGYTNSPADGLNCSHCMGGTAVPVGDWITSDIPSTGYVPGVTYNIMFSVSGDGNKGFELSPQGESGNLLGILTAGSDSKLVGAGKYITHKLDSDLNPAVWVFQWTAPQPGVGTITFYGCAAVGKLNTKTTTMVAPQNTLGIPGQERASFRCYPNPVEDALTVSFSPGEAGMTRIHMLSMDGKVVSSLFNGIRPAGDQTMVLPVDLEAGIYLLRIETGKETLARKIVVR